MTDPPSGQESLRLLFVPNWCVESVERGDGMQRADYRAEGQPYWFFEHFLRPISVDILDVRRWPFFEWEERLLGFYLLQGLAVLRKWKRYDVVVFHSSQSAVLPLALARLFRLSKPMTLLIDPACLNNARPEKRLQWGLTRWALGAVDRILWHSSSSKSFCEIHCPELAAKGSFVLFGLDVAALAGLQPVDGDYAICVGDYFRDWALLLEAWKRLPDCPLVLLGAGDQATSSLSNVLSLPRQPFRRYVEMLRRARMVVLPVPDGWGSWGQITLLQAMALGKPVIVTAVKPIADYASHGCVTVPDQDPQQLADAVAELWGNPKARRQLATRARRHVLSNFTEDTMGHAIEDVLTSVAARRPLD